MVLTVSSSNAEEYPVAAVPEGKLKGKYVFTRGGRKISQFLGVPYAEKPVGDLRFAVSNVLYSEFTQTIGLSGLIYIKWTN